MYNLYLSPPPPNPVMCTNPWNQISHKGQVFLDRKPLDCKLHRKDHTNIQMHGHRGKKVCTIQPRSLPVPHIHRRGSAPSQLTCACWGLPQIQSGLTKHQLLILSAEPVPPSVSVTRCWVIQNGNKEQLTCFYNTSWRKRNCILGHPGIFLFFFFVVGWRPIFFLTRERELPAFPQEHVSDSTPLFSYVLLFLYG